MNRRKTFFCIIFSLKMIFFWLSLISNNVYYIAILWINIDFSITIYFCLFIANEVSQIEFSIILIILYLFINFVFIWRKCDFHFNLKFNWIFNILRSIFALIRYFFNVMLMFMLYFFKIFEKWISLCFRSLNVKSCLFVHLTTLFHVFFNISQFCFVDLLYINMLISFTNLVALKCNLTFSHDFSKSAL